MYDSYDVAKGIALLIAGKQMSAPGVNGRAEDRLIFQREIHACRQRNRPWRVFGAFGLPQQPVQPCTTLDGIEVAFASLIA